MHNDDHISIDWSFKAFVFYVNCKTQDVGYYGKKSSQKIPTDEFQTVHE